MYAWSWLLFTCTLVCSTASVCRSQDLTPPQVSTSPPNRIALAIGWNGATSGGSFPGTMFSGLYARKLSSLIEIEASLGYFVGMSDFSSGSFWDRTLQSQFSALTPPVLDAFMVGDVSVNITPFGDGAFKHLAFGVGYSLRTLHGINMSSFITLPDPSGASITVPLPRFYREFDHGGLVRLEYGIPLDERLMLSLRGNGYISGKIAPMWGVHCLLSVRF